MPTANFDLTTRASFKHWTPVTIRFSDTDQLGHINNCAYATYFEASRVAYIDQLFERDRMAKAAFNTVLVRLLIDYKRELHYPGLVEVGARLIALGGKSFTTGYGCFQGEVCVAVCEAVNVCFDVAERRSILPPESFRERLRAELAGAG